ncbi:MAG: RNA-directed DNA polymerase [Alphaproteobacteria bacterium]|nr:RNA-directed DNA polymerase [Alphaproteobacteria bacterium]
MTFRYDLRLLNSRKSLLAFLGVDEIAFEKVLSFDPVSAQMSIGIEDDIHFLEAPLFLRHKIPKKNRARGYRIVWEPTAFKSEYKALARRLSNFLSHRLNGFPHSRTFGYIGGRNIRENARDHCGHRHLISFDLENFFPSISAARITKLLISTEIDPGIADLLSRFMTINGSLPLGLPTSPTLANAICLPMDIELQLLAQQHLATFSRYADDINFSSDTSLPPLEKFATLVKSNGFEIAKSKTRISKLGQAHYVTGLSISDLAHPHVPRHKKRRLRQELYYAQKYGLEDHLVRRGINDHQLIQHEINRLDGLVKFIAYHEPQLSAKLKTNWADILQESGRRPSFSPKNQARPPFCIYVDEAEYVRPDGTRLLAMGMAVSQHQDRVVQAAKDVLEETISDQWAAGNKPAIVKRGLHFADAHPDLRLAYIRRMRSLPFEGYVVMARLDSTASYEGTYIRLLNAIIRRRLMAAESQAALLVFEKNDKVSQVTIRQAVMQSYESLRKSNNRRPVGCYIDFVSKPDLGMSVPDFLLGILGRFLRSGPGKMEDQFDRDRKLFESLRDKYRLILDADSWVEYSRRREISPW